MIKLDHLFYIEVDSFNCTLVRKIVHNIQEVADKAKELYKLVEPFVLLTEQYINYLEEQEKHQSKINILLYKEATLGLTYFEKQRLKELY